MSSVTPISFYPRPRSLYRTVGPDSELEAQSLLENYFGQSVVLFSSGRSALRSYMDFKGLRLHLHTIEVPQFLSSCVLKAVADYAFPIHHTVTKSDCLLFYHQFGFPQSGEARQEAAAYPKTIEDNAHHFFDGTPSSLPRILSFTKFFNVNFGGAIILPEKSLAQELRAFRNRQPHSSRRQELQLQKALFDYYNAGGSHPPRPGELEIAYETIHHHPHPLNTTLAPLLNELRRLAKIESLRMDYFSHLRDCLKDPVAIKLCQQIVSPPFLMPCFFSNHPDLLKKLAKQFQRISVGAAVYHLDIHRNQFAPDYKKVLVIPCHQNLSWKEIKDMGKVIQMFQTNKSI